MVSRTVGTKQLLQQHFPDLTEIGLQEAINKVGILKTFRSGELIMDYGKYIQMVPLIVDGCLKVTRQDAKEGKELLLYFLQAGDTCTMAFSCCSRDKISAIRAETLEPTTIIGIPIENMNEWITQYKSWKNFIMLSYDKKMMDLVNVIDNISFRGLDDRMQQYLQILKRSTNKQTIFITHQEIATDLNVSREAVSRLLKKLESLGVVKLGRNQISFLE